MLDPDQEIRLNALRLACASPLTTSKHILARAEAFAQFIANGEIEAPPPAKEGANLYDQAIDEAREGLQV